MSNNHPQKGFTIIETLVAISVLMLAVAGPLVVANKALFAATQAKNQMIATFLAQESMEVIKNTRDNNINDQAPDWLLGMRDCKKNQPCDASSLDGGTTPHVKTNCPNDLCPLYMGNFGYSHNAGVSTLFKRGFYIHNPNSTGHCGSNDECAATVTVVWSDGILENSLEITSSLTNNLR